MAGSVYIDPRDIEIVTEVHGREGRFNPRTTSNPGFAKEKMDDLRTGIITDGLHNPLQIYMDREKPKLIAGERRLRAILGLVQEDVKAKEAIDEGNTEVQRVLVKNPRNGRMEPAIEVYVVGGVECKITDGDEKTRLRIAIQENTLHEALTDFECLLQCQQLEEAGFTREQQAETMGVSEAWISQSHSLLKANKAILDCMKKQLLTRTAALTFLAVPEDKVAAVLERAINLTYQEADKKELEAKEKLDQAMLDLEAAEQQLRVSQFTGNKQSANKARRSVANANRSASKAKDKIADAKNRKNKKITVETIVQAAKEVDASENLDNPQSMKHVRQVLGEITEVLKTGTMPKNDRRQVTLIQQVLLWVTNRNYIDHPLDLLETKKLAKVGSDD